MPRGKQWAPSPFDCAQRSHCASAHRCHHRNIIDAFCETQFNVRQNGKVGLTGLVDLQFGQVGNYWVTTASSMQISLRVLGIAVKHSTLRFQYSGMQFPSMIPADVFPPLSI